MNGRSTAGMSDAANRPIASVVLNTARHTTTWRRCPLRCHTSRSQIDAFVQRCSELLEVCESQIQLARKSTGERGKSGPLPEFGGTRGQEVKVGDAKGLLHNRALRFRWGYRCREQLQ